MSQLKLMFILVLLLANNLTLASPLGIRCEDIFLPKITPVKFNYRFIQTPYPFRPVGFGNKHHKIESGFSWLGHSKVNEIEAYNHSLKSENRKAIPIVDGLKGTTYSENWTHYTFENMPLILSNVLKKNSDQLSAQEKQMLLQILQVTQMGVKLKFKNSKNFNFDLQDEKHRIAITTGRIGDPIYLNEDFFTGYDLDKMGTGKDLILAWTNLSGDQKTQNLVTPQTIHMTPIEMERMNGAFEKQRFKNFFSILVHELGHYLGVKDNAERTLDLLSEKITNLAFYDIEVFEYNIEKQKMLKLFVLNMDKNKSQKQLLIFDQMKGFDLTQEIVRYLESKLKIEIENIDFSNFEWETLGHWDANSWMKPKGLMFDAKIKTNGAVVTYQLRLMIGTSMSSSSRAYVGKYGYSEKNIHEVMNTINTFSEHLGIAMQIRKLKNENEVVLIKEVEAYGNQNVFDKNNPWKISFLIESEQLAQIKDLQAYITAEDFVVSGFFKKEKIKSTKTWLEMVSSNKAFIHIETKMPLGSISREYFLDYVQLKLKDNSEFRFRPKIKEKIMYQGSTAKPSKLLFYGFDHAYTEPFKYSKLHVNVVQTLLPGQIYMFNYFFSNLRSIKRAEITATVLYEDSNGISQSEVFVFNPLKNDVASLFPGHDISVLTENHVRTEMHLSASDQLVLMRIGFLAPDTINGKKVRSISFENMYLLFDNLDQVFEPISKLLLIER